MPRKESTARIYATQDGELSYAPQSLVVARMRRIPPAEEGGKVSYAMRSDFIRTGQRMTLDLTPYGTSAMLRFSTGESLPIRILSEDQMKGHFFPGGDAWRVSVFHYPGEGKNTLLEDIKEMSEEGVSIASDHPIAAFMRELEFFSVHKQVLLQAPSLQEQSDYLLSMPGFVSGRDYSQDWKMSFVSELQDRQNKPHPPMKLFQSKPFFDGTIGREGRAYLYEIQQDEEYLILAQSHSGWKETGHTEKTVHGSYNRACGAFDAFCQSLHTKPESLSRAEKERRAETCHKEADRRYAEIQKAKEKPLSERTGGEIFQCFLADGMEKGYDYGTYAARLARQAGWTTDAIFSAMTRYAPDVALDPISKELPYAVSSLKALEEDRTKGVTH